jgi:hypothetical protein
VSTDKIPWEDHLLERKTEGDLKDLRKTAVGFANSVRPGHTAVILIGENDNGTAAGVKNADELQRKIRVELEKVYPPIVFRQAVYQRDGRSCVRVEIEYSGDTPHFGDAAWIRKGSETVKAPDEMLQKLIELRQSKVRELAKWIGRGITVSWSNSRPPNPPNWLRFECKVVEVTGFYATFVSDKWLRRHKSEPLSWLEISWDDETDRLQVFVNPEMSPMFDRP